MPIPSSPRATLRRVLLLVVVLPAMATLAVLAYAWPAARIAPRDLPVGIVGAGQTGQQVVKALATGKPGAFDVRAYPDAAAARNAIRHRDVYGAFVVSPADITVLEASAASTAVAQSLDQVGQQLVGHLKSAQAAHASAGPSHNSGSAQGSRPAAGPSLSIQDVVPTAASDPRGAVFSAALLPLTICSVLIAAAVVMVGSRWRGVQRLAAVSAAGLAAGLGSYLIAQGFLGALPHQAVATWAALSLTIAAMSLTTAGLARLIGNSGIAVTAMVMVFIGNPFSGVTSAPPLLPDGVRYIGQALPPGAGANLLRSTAYFDGNGAEGPLIVLLAWALFGAGALLLGRDTASAPEEVGAGRRSAA